MRTWSMLLVVFGVTLKARAAEPLANATSGDEGPVAWAAELRSPRPYRASTDALWALCPEPDQALTLAARWVAQGSVASDDAAASLKVAGDPHVGARTFTLEGPRLTQVDIAARVRSWMSGTARRGVTRCGFASAETPNGSRFAAITVDALADLAPVPVRARPGTWVDVDARLLVPAHGAKVVLQSPNGDVRGLLTSFFAGHVKARANLDHPGTWVFQVLIEDASGPRPALDAQVFAGVEPVLPPPRAAETTPLRGAAVAADPASFIFDKLSGARLERGLRSLLRDPRLDELAQRHSRAMRDARQLAHNAGDGDPSERLRAAAYPARSMGENVAHADSAALADRALWSSPSHRANIIDTSFDRAGVGVTSDPDGSLWVTELFASVR